MDKETLLNKIKEIGTCEDAVQRRTMLAELNDEVTTVFDENETLKTSNQQYETDNETLRQANMKLFLRVGNDKTEEERKEDTTGVKTPDESKRKFEDLFNEKGGIK